LSVLSIRHSPPYPVEEIQGSKLIHMVLCWCAACLLRNSTPGSDIVLSWPSCLPLGLSRRCDGRFLQIGSRYFLLGQIYVYLNIQELFTSLFGSMVMSLKTSLTLFGNTFAVGPLYWPMFVLATMSASIASQAIISATFSIIKQATALGCFPRIKVVHTSSRLQGQVYIPEVNWMLMIFCVIIIAGFRDTPQIGNAYGTSFLQHFSAKTSLWIN
jgi:hypothetical protein